MSIYYFLKKLSFELLSLYIANNKRRKNVVKKNDAEGARILDFSLEEQLEYIRAQLQKCRFPNGKPDFKETVIDDAEFCSKE
jgi:hypothetical protein